MNWMANTVLHWAVVKSPIGDLVLLGSSAGLTRIAWDVSNPSEFAASEADRGGFTQTSSLPVTSVTAAGQQLADWFGGRRIEFDVPLSPDPRAKDSFSGRVLLATSRIPSGQTVTYGEIARAAGAPSGYRAAGNALGGNPIPIIVPCHRVVAANGLGGFGGGRERKLLLLAIEQA
ncbi:MAG: methylated-DNA--[protein]-cysteine S-methyltransferase [Actinobacteria bacterium]|uniref:methylated-DNA--[protein]-cysteine S-methyltransferase n=1 Tax=freshwater metagenome TaxID=449393 RepID=A0A6J7EAW1_9ZZZZ|nr:methylated-DNA--[protein]-cysteine S-methyltransferase [Actinomycetota bacterium]